MTNGINRPSIQMLHTLEFSVKNYLTDAGFDYAKMFIVKDQLCDGTKWQVRTVPANPATDAYFPIGQAALSLVVEDGKLNVTLKTLTPNFKLYEMQIDGGGWKLSGENFPWKVHPGSNRLEARTFNQFGVAGPHSTAALEIAQ